MMVWCRETLGSSFPALRVGAAMAPNRTTIKETRGDAALFGTISVGAAALEKQTGSIGATLPSSLQDFVVNLHHQRIATLFLNVRKSGWYSFLISRQPTWLAAQAMVTRQNHHQKKHPVVSSSLLQSLRRYLHLLAREIFKSVGRLWRGHSQKPGIVLGIRTDRLANHRHHCGGRKKRNARTIDASLRVRHNGAEDAGLPVSMSELVVAHTVFTVVQCTHVVSSEHERMTIKLEK
jgi:hypothetical protein